MSDELVTWLGGVLDDVEQTAPAIHHEMCSSVVRTVRNGVVWPAGDCDCGYPARVLAQVAATRRLVDEHTRVWIEPGHPHFNDAHLTKEPMPICRSCEPMRQFRREQSWPCRTLKLLALPFADRPGYKPEWAPDAQTT